MKYALTLVFLLISSNFIHAQTCNPSIPRTAPDSRYELVVGSGGSEVKDKQTGLIWQRCSIGQTWSGTSCTGTPIPQTWTNALQQAKDYGGNKRLPNIKELQTLAEKACYNSAINELFFPNTIASVYWSSSPVASSNDYARVVSFDTGHSSYSYKNYTYQNDYGYIRLVRSQTSEVARTKDQPTTLNPVQYTKSKVGNTLIVDAKDSGIEDGDGVANVVYKMFGSPKPCNFRTFYTQKEYVAQNGHFEIGIPQDSCGYSYYLYAEADVLNVCTRTSSGADGKPITTTSRTAVGKRSKVIELKDSQDKILTSDPFGVTINVPNTCN